MKNKILNNYPVVIVTAMIICHPALFLLTIYNELKSVEMGSAAGVLFIGICLGVVFYKLCGRLNPDFKSAAGVIFLLTPLILFLLTAIKTDLIAVNFNSNFFWTVFLFIYLVSGAALYIKNNSGKLNKTELYIVSLCVPFLILSLIIVFITRGLIYSPDSYGYYDISKSIFKDFGYVSVTRQYVEFTDYGISFPYLFPAIIAVFNLFTGFGMLSGTCINIIVTLISLYYILKISSKLSGSAVPGLIVSLVLFFNQDYAGEMISARAVPLSLLCALLIINIFSHSYSESEKPGKKELFLAGLFAGAGMVIRFDFLVISGLLGIILLFIYKKNILKFVSFYCFGLLVFTSPWILYSIIHFGKLWISDNSGTMFLITPQLPQRFYTPTETVPDIFSNFKGWFINRQNIIMNGLSGIFSIIARPVEMTMVLGITGMGVLSKIKRSGDYGIIKKTYENFKLLLLFTILIYSVKTMAIIMVGYADLRYHTEALITVSLIILCAFYISYPNRKLWIYFTALIFTMSVIVNLQPAFKDPMQTKLLSDFINTAAITADDEIKQIEDILTKASGTENPKEIRLFYVDGNPYNAYKIGAFSDIKTYARITNINADRLLYLMKYYIKPGYIYLPENEKNWLYILSEQYLLKALSIIPPLYSVEALSPADNNSIRLPDITDNSWNNGIGINSQFMLFRNSEENRAKLENAVGFEYNGIYAGIEAVNQNENDWIYVRCSENIDLSPFAYPNLINIVK